MDGDRDLRLILLALREGVIDPGRLAAAAADWATDPTISVLDYLTARGVITPEECRRLAHAANPPPAPGAATDTAGPAAPSAHAMATVGLSELDIPATPPTVGDRYRVTGLHRAGGLGRVWRATDTTLGRTVALKDLRPEKAAHPALQARFVEEARVTGQLEHPSIVPLYDLIDGPNGPCYTMRFVAGQTLAEAARDYHRDRAAGRADPLALATLMDAFVAVCRAVAYAHARAILHRDLKGQNIVLGEYGEVFVLDWGLAKVVGEVGADGPATIMPNPTGVREPTVTGAVLGTPAFMAPELAAGGPATAATDVYALGAVLYVVLTGRPPYEGEGVDDVLGQVLAADPPRPRAVNPAAPPELEAICLKAMARHPSARYPSADELAVDVRRWRADEPIGAYPEPWPTWAARWARRHRPAAAGAAAVLLTAAIGLGVSTAVVWQEERRTEREWARAEEILDWASSLSVSLMDISDTQLPMIRQTKEERRAMAADCLETFRNALARRPDDPKLRQQTARAYRYSGNLHRLINQTAIAEQSYSESVRLLDDLVAQFPDDTALKSQLAGALQDQARLLSRLGRLNDATTSSRRSAELFERLLAADPAQRDLRPRLANNLLDLSGYEFGRAEFSESEASARRGVDLIRTLVQGPAPRPDDRLLLVMALHRLAITLRELDRPADSLAASGEALAQLQNLPADDSGAQHYRGRVLVEQAKVLIRFPDRRAQAERDIGQSILLWDTLQAKAPEIAMYLEWQASAYEVRGRVRATLRESVPAVEDLEKARTMFEQLIVGAPSVPAYQALLGRTYLTLGRLEAERGDAGLAAEALAKARDAFRGAVAGSPENALHRRSLAEAEAELMRVAPPSP